MGESTPIRSHYVFKDIRKTLDRLSQMSPAGKVMSQLIEALLQSRLEYDVTWDDLRAPATAINPPGTVSDPDVDEDGTFLFTNISVQQIAIIFQMSHMWQEGTAIRPHAHWSKTTDAAGDVVWELRYRVIETHPDASEVPPVWSSWAPIVSRSQAVASDQTLLIDTFADIPMLGRRSSALVSTQIRRNTGAGGDTYGTDARLWEVDLHYQLDSTGTLLEYFKEVVGI